MNSKRNNGKRGSQHGQLTGGAESWTKKSGP
jgi:hypothetical protein